MVAWTLVFHLIGLAFWLGSLLVVTHILAFHVEETSDEARATLGRLEMRLLHRLAHPGAAIMVITGVLLVTQDPLYLRERWLHAKLLLVAILIGLDLIVYLRVKAFNAGSIQLRRGECMALHGAIALVFFGILILVLTKPFGVAVRRGALDSARPQAAAARSRLDHWPMRGAAVSSRGRNPLALRASN